MPDKDKKIAISGASGLVGTALRHFLQNHGYTCISLVRDKNLDADSESIFWDPYNEIIDAEQLNGLQAVIHLSGENISSFRWSESKKKRILGSRVQTTRFLSQTLSKLEVAPEVFISASATGFYGDVGDEIVTEGQAHGDDFLANVCHMWEAETLPATEAGIRVVPIRQGIILSKEGGVLPLMSTPFKLGVGGKIGSGKQYCSWIDIEDLLYAIKFIIVNDDIEGPVNMSSPNPVTNLELTKALGKVLKRPTLFPVPAFLVKIILGEMGESLLLTSTRCIPAKLSQAGFTFMYPTIEASLENHLER
jgi:hypothetical protein